MFRFIDFQNNSFIVTFLYSIITIWKRFLRLSGNTDKKLFKASFEFYQLQTGFMIC